MSYTFEEIVGIVRQRQESQSDLLNRMLEIKERYNGDYVIPLPSMDNEPILPPLTPALISENILNTQNVIITCVKSFLQAI